eukprot:8036988-Alexandrium_andersonii.AAC.1
MHARAPASMHARARTHARTRVRTRARFCGGWSRVAAAVSGRTDVNRSSEGGAQLQHVQAEGGGVPRQANAKW